MSMVSEKLKSTKTSYEISIQGNFLRLKFLFEESFLLLKELWHHAFYAFQIT